MWLSFVLVLPCYLIAWMPSEYQDCINSIECELSVFETAFDTNVHVKASISYPRVPETSLLARYVNKAVQKEAHELHDLFVQEMSAPLEELWDEDADERKLRYDLGLIYSTSNLMSFYGYQYEYLGGAHGSVRYITKTFWQQDDTIFELSLNDLFLPKFREWLFQHCENYFKSNRCGYYSDDDYSWVIFNPEHLDAFLLTEKGLLLIFQNYIVSGYDDYPTTLLIPYPALKPFVNPEGPIPSLLRSD